MAWRVPPLVNDIYDGCEGVEGSAVPAAQRDLVRATKRTLAAVVADVRAGLAETIGVGVELAEGERTSVVVELPVLPDEFTPQHIARAINMENVEAWCDERGQVHVAVSPWYSTKDIDQTVLSITKVLHVLLGLHATADAQLTNDNAHTSLWRRMLAATAEIAALQKGANRR